MEKRFLTTTEFTVLVGCSAQKLRDLDEKGDFKPHHVSDGGWRYYSPEQEQQYYEKMAELNRRKKEAQAV